MTDELTPEWTDPDDAPEWTDADFARAEIRKGGVIIRPERNRDELTLREKVLSFVEGEINHGQPIYDLNATPIVNGIASILEDTGSPAHMRVAAELRGE